MRSRHASSRHASRVEGNKPSATRQPHVLSSATRQAHLWLHLLPHLLSSATRQPHFLDRHGRVTRPVTHLFRETSGEREEREEREETRDGSHCHKSLTRHFVTNTPYNSDKLSLLIISRVQKIKAIIIPARAHMAASCRAAVATSAPHLFITKQQHTSAYVSICQHMSAYFSMLEDR
jgi:hypothetical protein